MSVALGPDVAGPLLGTVPAAFHAGVTDVLLTGLAVAAGAAGSGAGRPSASSTSSATAATSTALDLTRTVGWHTALHPARLDLAGLDVDDASGRRTGRRCRAQGGEGAAPRRPRRRPALRAAPLARPGRPRPASLRLRTPGPQISFNYGGRRARDDGGEPATGRRPATTPTSPPAPRPCRSPTSSTSTPRPSTGPTARNWRSAGRGPPRCSTGRTSRSLAGLLRRGAAGGWRRTPPRRGGRGRARRTSRWSRLTQADLDDLEGRFGRLADVLPLTPLQEGFFFHSQLEDGHDPYLPQTVFDLGDGRPGPVDAAPSCAGRWRRCSTGTPTCGPASPSWRRATVVSVVPRQAPVPWREVDLAGRPEAEQAEALSRLAEEDLAAGFDLGRPPLIRLTLAQLGGGRARLVITTHHVLMDGWSLPVFYEELALTYDAGGDTSGLEPARPFRDYLAWLGRAATPTAGARRLAGGAGRAGGPDAGGSRAGARARPRGRRGRAARGRHRRPRPRPPAAAGSP